MAPTRGRMLAVRAPRSTRCPCSVPRDPRPAPPSELRVDGLAPEVVDHLVHFLDAGGDGGGDDERVVHHPLELAAVPAQEAEVLSPSSLADSTAVMTLP